MTWKESVKLFLDYNLDRRRYFTGVLTGVTISLVVATVTGVLWLANRFIQWVAGLTALLVDIPIPSQEFLRTSSLILATAALFLTLIRLFLILNKIGNRAETKADENSTRIANTLETLIDLARSLERQREYEAQRIFDEQSPPSFAGVTGDKVPASGYYQSLDDSKVIVRLEKGYTFPPSITPGSGTRLTSWKFIGLSFNEIVFATESDEGVLGL